MNKKIILFFVLISAIWAFSAVQDSVGVAKINGKLHLRYMVSPGETIYRISTKYKTSVSDLMDINPELEFGLKTGQIINIPYNMDVVAPAKMSEKAVVVMPTQPASTANDSITEMGVLHTITAGETYTSLSKKYNISVDDLLKLNKVQLKTGQKIIVNELIKAQSTANIKKNVATTNAEVKNTKVDNITNTTPVISEKITPKQEEISSNNLPESDANNVSLVPIEYTNQKKKVLIVPFDPYLYFSDADDEIAAGSKMSRIKVRQAFRRRLNALLEPPGYETVCLLGGKAKDSITDLNRVYNSVSYSYQDVLYNPNATLPNAATQAPVGIGRKQKMDIPLNISDNSRAAQASDAKKYFGVKVRNIEFYTYFNNKYFIDYYIFINQFEVKTNYENCLDRATLNYERGFTIHYSIFDKNGKQVAGNRIYVDYNSNTNQIQKILTDNMQKVADKIMGDLPKVD